MANITVSLPADGDSIVAANYNTPVNTIVNEINGKLDNSNIASGAAIDGAKLANSTVDTNQLADEAVTSDKIDFATQKAIIYTGSGSVADGDTFTGYTAVATATDLFTYASGIFTCVTSGVYKIDYYVNFNQASAGTTANNEFKRSSITFSVGTNVAIDAVAVRSTLWTASGSITREISAGQNVRIIMSNSAGISGSLTVTDLNFSITRVL